MGLEKIKEHYSKVKVGAKRDGEELEEDSDSGRKRVKMRDLQSVLQSEGIDTHDPETSKSEESEEPMDIVETQSSQVLGKNAVADVRQSERVCGIQSSHLVDHNGSRPLDLNSDACTDENDTAVSLKDASDHFLYSKPKPSSGHKQLRPTSTRLDLNAEDVASSAVQEPVYAHRPHNQSKAKDCVESGKTSGRLEEKDALRKWKEMKENGFMSPSYGGIPAAPKPRVRKSKSDSLKQKMEQAKKEQVDRFTKIAAPSGLLNGLNPGIINHVRNSKQVHSIIQSLVRSEKRESRKQAGEHKAGSKEQSHRTAEEERMHLPGLHRSSFSCEGAPYSSMPQSKLLYKNHLSLHHHSISTEDSGSFREWFAKEGNFQASTSFGSHLKGSSENDILALKLSSGTMASDNASCLSNEESANNSVDTLSVKAATVASQWLQLLQQDIKGRLAALLRSKKRLHAVINTELPFLLSKEFPQNQENDTCVSKDSALGGLSNATAHLHQAKWSSLFNQMDSALSEEEKQLEAWLSQVSKMLTHCDEGLQRVQWNTLFEMPRLGALDSQFRSRISDVDKDLSVQAAAASMYATCDFLSSRENVSCC